MARAGAGIDRLSCSLILPKLKISVGYSVPFPICSYSGLAMAQQALGDQKGAITTFETILEVFPNNPSILQELGKAWAKLNAPEKSQYYFKRADAARKKQSSLRKAQEQSTKSPILY